MSNSRRPPSEWSANDINQVKMAQVISASSDVASFHSTLSNYLGLSSCEAFLQRLLLEKKLPPLRPSAASFCPDVAF